MCDLIRPLYRDLTFCAMFVTILFCLPCLSGFIMKHRTHSAVKSGVYIMTWTFPPAKNGKGKYKKFIYYGNLFCSITYFEPHVGLYASLSPYMIHTPNNWLGCIACNTIASLFDLRHIQIVAMALDILNVRKHVGDRLSPIFVYIASQID